MDIYATKSLSELIYELGRVILSVLKSKERKAWERFIQVVGSLRTGITLDALGQPCWNLQIGDIQSPKVSLDEIFQYLGSADKPCIVAIDEFQTIMDYPEQNVEALLRTYIQDCNNARFIFSGSKRHMMGEMFSSPARPFYQSASTLSLISSASAVQRSLSALQEKDIVTNHNGNYYIYDYFLYYWLTRN